MKCYFDHNASTPLDDRVLEAMLPYLSSHYANPSSTHAQGKRVRESIENAREQVAALVDAHASQVIFTSGGTEANNLAIKGAVKGMDLTRAFCSAVEHPSVRDAVRSLQRVCDTGVIKVDENGLLVNEHLERLLESGIPALISVMLANNETGTIQNIQKIAERLKEREHLLHTDAVQAVGKIPVNFDQLSVHLMSLSSHKIYGPKGAGALIYNKRLEIDPLFHGGGQEKGLRSGTENVAAIVGFGMAAELAKKELSVTRNALLHLQQYFEERLEKLPGVTIYAKDSNRIPNTTFFSVEGIEGETLLLYLDGHGVAVSSGSACSSVHAGPSQVLTAMGVPEHAARGAIRVSFGKANTTDEIDYLLDVLERQIIVLPRYSVSLV